MSFAIIPARGGSKRIPRKNIREFAGKPMISYPIELALRSGCFERVVVSTDDVEIDEIARHFGAETIFPRPVDLSSDHATTRDVLLHAFDSLGILENSREKFCCVYPCTPLLLIDDVQAGLAVLDQDDVSYSFAAALYPHPIERAFAIDEAGRVCTNTQKFASIRTQDLQPSYHDAGQFYFGFAEDMRQGVPIFGPRSVPIIIPRARAQDIDEEDDWTFAEILYRTMKS